MSSLTRAFSEIASFTLHFGVRWHLIAVAAYTLMAHMAAHLIEYELRYKHNQLYFQHKCTPLNFFSTSSSYYP